MRRRTLALIALAGMLVLAGCSSGGTTTAPETQTDTETVTVPATATETATETATTEAGDQPAAVDADQLTSDTLAAMEAVDAYHAVTNTSVLQSVGDQQQRQTAVAAISVDRADQRIGMNQTLSAGNTTRQTRLFFLNGSVYQYDARFVERYGSEWVTGDVGEGFFERQDNLARQRAFLANATVTANGTTTVDGIETRRLEADVDEEATREAIIAQLGGARQGVTYNVSHFDQRVWVDVDTARPVRVTNTLNASISQFGQTVDVSMDVTLTVEYGREIDVTLPEAADSAVTIGNESST